MFVRWIVLECLLCGLGTAVAARPNPVPLINEPLHPASVAPGARNVVVTVKGTGFVSGSVVRFNQQSLPTTFVDAQTLTATVPGSDLATPRSALVTVVNPKPGGGVSNAAFFEVTKATPSVFLFPKYAGPTPPVTTNSVIEGDFNGDGKLDLAMAAATSIYIALGNGDGTFQVISLPTTAQFVGTLLAGDFNGDGKLDLAFPDPFHNLVHLFLGNGDGTFTDVSSTSVGNYPVWAAAGDFNGDGKLDLAVSNQHSGTVSILLGNGNGTFSRRATLRVGSKPNALTVGDFNGDGKLDLAVVNSGSNTLSILLGHGDGTFGLKSSPATGASPYAVAAADFNGDGKLDLAVTNACGNATSCNPPAFGSVTVLLGAGDGTFTASSVVLTDYHNPLGIAAADFNGDGRADLVVTGLIESNGIVLFGNSKGRFGNMIATPHSANAQTVVAGDFNNDGRLDFAVNSSVAVDGSGGAVIEEQSPVAFYPPALTFPPQTVGTTSPPKAVRFANVGSMALHISQVQSGGNFSETNDCPATLDTGASCTITVTFTPGFVGVTGGIVAVTDDALGIDQQMGLVGTGK
jgi:FG-GAP-like repeat